MIGPKWAVSSRSRKVLLFGTSAAAFGIQTWVRFPDEIVARAHLTLAIGPGPSDDIAVWGLAQTAFGLVRRLGGSAALASAVQAATTLVATPYAFRYSLTAIAIPVAFLIGDQIEQGVPRDEQTLLLAPAVAGFLAFARLGKAPVGALIVLAVLGVVLRRVRDGEAST